ncbi:hypothetical protein ACFYV5_10120 [Streptomyces sp. NPDC003035]|uniref:hypothetical protein n=1 Tax=Streptomyces sp. NPDC003035 TaxID=3364676 RepID=UPI003679AA1D
MPSPKHSRGRRPRIVFIEPAETQVRALSAAQAAILDGTLNAIAADPDAVKPHAPQHCVTTSRTASA